MKSRKKLYKSTRILVFSALLIALDVIFTRFLRWEIYPYDRYSLQFLSHGLSGILFGPIIALVNCVAGDLVGMLLNSGGLSLYLPVTANCALRGVLYGLLLWKKPASLVRILIAVALVTVLCDLLINSWIMSGFYGLPYWTIFVTKLPLRIASIPLYSFVLWFVWYRLGKTHMFDGLVGRERR